jgi:hypothetical protein
MMIIFAVKIVFNNGGLPIIGRKALGIRYENCLHYKKETVSPFVRM